MTGESVNAYLRCTSPIEAARGVAWRRAAGRGNGLETSGYVALRPMVLPELAALLADDRELAARRTVARALAIGARGSEGSLQREDSATKLSARLLGSELVSELVLIR